MEFRPMRRIRQELPNEECEKILNNATAGVLSVLGDGGYTEPAGQGEPKNLIPWDKLAEFFNKNLK